MCGSDRNALSWRILQEFKRRGGGDEIDGREEGRKWMSSVRGRSRSLLARPPISDGTFRRPRGHTRHGRRCEPGTRGAGTGRRRRRARRRRGPAASGPGRGGSRASLSLRRNAARTRRAGPAPSGPGTRRPRGGRVAPLPPRALGGAAPAGAVQGAGRDGDVVPRRSRKSLSGHGVADPARFLSFSLPLEPAAARSRRGEPDPSLRTAPHPPGLPAGNAQPARSKADGQIARIGFIFRGMPLGVDYFTPP